MPKSLPLESPSELAGLLSAADLAALLGVSRRTVYRLRERGLIPSPVAVTGRIVRWRLSDIRGYLDRLRPPRTEPPV